MRIRTLKPSFIDHEDLVSLPDEARLLAAILPLYCDDEGRFVYKPYMGMQIWPLDPERYVTAIGHLRDWYCIEYSVGKKTIIQVCNFAAHQRINKPRPSELPEPPEHLARKREDGTFEPVSSTISKGEGSIHVGVPDPSRSLHVGVPGGKGSGKGSGKGKGKGSGRELGSKEPLSSSAKPRHDRAREVFDYWVLVMHKKPTSVFNAKRKRAVQARLKEGYSVETLKAAIDGCRQSVFHMGQNDRGKLYNDLELICRDGTKVEGFLESNSGRGAFASPVDASDIDMSDVEESNRELEEHFGAPS